MGAEGGPVAETWAAPPRWAARIRRADGGVVGTGVLLSPDRVLTCAHVVAEGQDYVAEFVGPDGGRIAAVDAFVLPEAYVPGTTYADEDPGGDLALLRLAEPRPAEEAVRLHRLSSSGRTVRIHGFPRGRTRGVTLTATLTGGIRPGGQVRLGPGGEGEPTRDACAGAGVVDVETGRVIGLLTNGTGPPGSAAVMSPAETVVRHLPQVGAWTTGRTAVDEGLRAGAQSPDTADRSLLDEAFAQRLAAWYRGGGYPVKVSRVPPDDPKRSATLRRAIKLADRELRPPASTGRPPPEPPGTVPHSGAHDLACDAAGLSARELAERIAERTGLGRDPAVPAATRVAAAGRPLTLVLVGVDEAEDPDDLLDLLDLLRRSGNRMLLVFSTADDSYLRAMTELVIRPAQLRLQEVHRLLDETAGPLAEHLERQAAVVRADAGDGRDAVRDAYSLRGFLAGPVSEVRTILGIEYDLARIERTTGRLHRRTRDACTRLDALVGRHTELTGRLHNYSRLLQRSPRGEDRPHHGEEEVRPAAADLAGADLFLAAHLLLEQRPCDVAEAAGAVARYQDFVERRLGDDPGGEGAYPS